MIFKKGGKYHVVWHGITEACSGYGESNNLMVKTLLASTKVVPHSIYEGENLSVGITNSPAMFGMLEQLPTPYTVMMTMFETDKWPQDWVNACNCANQVWVPSSWCKESLLASGCESPVSVVPIGIDDTIYKPAPEPKAESSTFTIGYAGAWSLRKGSDLLVKAFLEEFGNSDDVRLLVQSSSILSSTIPTDSRITVFAERRTTDEMADFYRSLDLFVMPTRGEGLGLTPLEAMACGVCSAVTDWGGSTDYLGDHSLRIAIDGLESCGGYHGSAGKWAKPSIASIRYCMRWAYEHREDVRRMGEESAEYVRKNWSIQSTAKQIEKLVSKIDPKERVQIESKEVVVWHGDPMKVIVPGVGGFTRAIPRGDLTPAQLDRINFEDGRFRLEKRYSRKKT